MYFKLPSRFSFIVATNEGLKNNAEKLSLKGRDSVSSAEYNHFTESSAAFLQPKAHNAGLADREFSASIQADANTSICRPVGQRRRSGFGVVEGVI